MTAVEAPPAPEKEKKKVAAKEVKAPKKKRSSTSNPKVSARAQKQIQGVLQHSRAFSENPIEARRARARVEKELNHEGTESRTRTKRMNQVRKAGKGIFRARREKTGKEIERLQLTSFGKYRMLFTSPTSRRWNDFSPELQARMANDIIKSTLKYVSNTQHQIQGEKRRMRAAEVRAAAPSFLQAGLKLLRERIAAQEKKYQIMPLLARFDKNDILEQGKYLQGLKNRATILDGVLEGIRTREYLVGKPRRKARKYKPVAKSKQLVVRKEAPFPQSKVPVRKEVHVRRPVSRDQALVVHSPATKWERLGYHHEIEQARKAARALDIARASGNKTRIRIALREAEAAAERLRGEETSRSREPKRVELKPDQFARPHAARREPEKFNPIFGNKYKTAFEHPKKPEGRFKKATKWTKSAASKMGHRIGHAFRRRK